MVLEGVGGASRDRGRGANADALLMGVFCLYLAKSLSVFISSILSADLRDIICQSGSYFS